MNGLDIVLFNVISYLGGILSGIYIHYKMNKNKDKGKDSKDSKDNKDIKEKEFDKYDSPVLTAQPVPSAPPPMNPLGGTMQKRITITTE